MGNITTSALPKQTIITTAKLPVVTSLKDRPNHHLRLVFFGDLHGDYRNLFKIANTVDNLRRQHHLDILVNLGDLIEGGQYPQQFIDIIRVCNGMGVDFSVFGNHEFDFEDDSILSGTYSLWQELVNTISESTSKDILRKNHINNILLTIRHLQQQLLTQIKVITSGKNTVLETAIRKANFPFLAMNLNFAPGSRLSKYKGRKILPYYVYEKGGQSFYFIGITTESLTHEFDYHKRRGFESTISVNAEPVENQLIRTIKLLKAQHGKYGSYIVVASHLGLPKDIEVAKSVPNIDLILGSHTHNTVYKMVGSPEERGIPIIHTGLKGQAIGVVDIGLSNGNLVVNPCLLDIESQPESHKYRRVSSKNLIYKPRVIGQINKPVSIKYKSTQPSALFNLITDIYRKYSDADIAFSFAGNVRNDLAAGKVTETDIENMLPWPSPLSIVTVEGTQIIEALEFAVAASCPGSPKVLLLHPSGLIYSIGENNSIEGVMVLEDDQYVPLDLKKQYKIALPQYLAKEGIPGFPLTLKKAKRFEETKHTDKELVIMAFTKEGTIIIDETPRIIIDPNSELLYNDPDITY